MTLSRLYAQKVILASLVLHFSCHVVQATSPQTEKADPARYLEHVRFLASPNLEGRAAGTEGLETAADYIVKQFESLGLEPGAGDGSYLQPFIVTTGA